MFKESKISKVIKELEHLFKHENLHFWFGQLLNSSKYFRNGFTEYYEKKIDLHYNSNKKDFVDAYNDRLVKYFTSPANNYSDEEIEKYFFKSPFVQKLPYNKGYLIAAQIDSIIALDKALKKMIILCKKDKRYCVFNKEN